MVDIIIDEKFDPSSISGDVQRAKDTGVKFLLRGNFSTESLNHPNFKNIVEKADFIDKIYFAWVQCESPHVTKEALITFIKEVSEINNGASALNIKVTFSFSSSAESDPLLDAFLKFQCEEYFGQKSAADGAAVISQAIIEMMTPNVDHISDSAMQEKWKEILEGARNIYLNFFYDDGDIYNEWKSENKSLTDECNRTLFAYFQKVQSVQIQTERQTIIQDYLNATLEKINGMNMTDISVSDEPFVSPTSSFRR